MKLQFTFAAVLLALPVHAWDYEGHRAVNLLAFAALPTNFPAFALTAEAKERVAFLSGEPDRWRNMGDGRKPWNDVVLSHFSGPDHYLDLEQLTDVGLNPLDVPIFRYDFTVQLARPWQHIPISRKQLIPRRTRIIPVSSPGSRRGPLRNTAGSCVRAFPI